MGGISHRAYRVGEISMIPLAQHGTSLSCFRYRCMMTGVHWDNFMVEGRICEGWALGILA